VIDINAASLDESMPWFEKIVTLTPPNNDVRRRGFSTEYDTDEFSKE
jgi:choline dehydrogenase